MAEMSSSIPDKNGKASFQSQNQNLIVALRIRPMSEDEIVAGATPIGHKVDKDMVVLMDPTEDPDDILRANRTREKQFVFDRCFDGSITQEEVYRHCCEFLIPNVIHGFNATVFAYGATGAGKTYTMLGTDTDPGIMARALNALFLEMERTSEDMSYKVTMSYLEIYNEMIRDLLNPSTGYLDMREDSKGVQVAGLSEVSARSTGEVMDMLQKGNKERTCEPTAANKTSSRSHAVLQVTVKQRNRIRNIMQEVRVGKLFLIDLAGSERAANTHNKGKRMVEGAHINRSLLALGNCINALSDKNGQKYINYRDSKLTRLLKDALGGNSQTVMVAHISPASIHFEESRNTLLYADRAKHIKTKVRRNVMDVSYHIAQYTNIITELREEIKRLRFRLDQNAEKNNASTIHAIQTEVLQAARTEDQTELIELKEQLLKVFKDQMELRRSLMELNNTDMEITLETARNQLLIQRWEREKSLKQKLEDRDLEKRDIEKDSSTIVSEIPEPEEVQASREELKALDAEREKTKKLKNNVSKELDNAKERADRIQTELPSKVNNEEQQEILSLLCKVHELEIENMEMQSSCLLRNFELRQRDMMIQKHQQHHGLCDEIINQQRALIDEKDMDYPRELEELYDLYQEEIGQRPTTPEMTLPPIHATKNGSLVTLNQKFLESDSFSDMERISFLDGESSSVFGARNVAPSAYNRKILKKSSHSLGKVEENEKFFSRSAKTQEIREAKAKEEEALGSGTASNSSINHPSKNHRQQSIITLSSRSTSSPSPPGAETNLVKSSIEDKNVIASRTRNIAALAAKRKKSKVGDFLDPHADFSHMGANQNQATEGDSYLSASRLAEHNSLTQYDPTPNIGMTQMIDAESVGTTEQEVGSIRNYPVRAKHKGTRKTNNHVGRPSKSLAKPNDNVNYQQLNKISPRRAADQMSVSSVAEKRNGRLTRLPKTTQNKNPRPRLAASNNPGEPLPGFDIDAQTTIRFDFEAQTTSNISQSNASKGRGQTVHRKIKGPASDVSSRPSNGKRPPPSIPTYGKADFGVTGTAYSMGGQR